MLLATRINDSEEASILCRSSWTVEEETSTLAFRSR